MNHSDQDHRHGGKRRGLLARSPLWARIRAYFLAGVLVTAPLAITLYIAWIFVTFIDNQVEGVVPPELNPNTYLPFSIPGLGLVLVLVFLTLIGSFTAGYLGRLVIRVYEMALARMPVIRSLYGATKQIMETVLANQSQAFREVVLIEYPRRGLWSIAFITGRTEGEIQNLTEDSMVNVFLPTTPNPTSGYLLFVPAQDIVHLKMSVEEGVKLVISGGIVAPPDRRPDAERAKPVVASQGAGVAAARSDSPPRNEDAAE